MGARSRGSALRFRQPVTLSVQADLAGRLVRRYKRFLADVKLANGRTLTVHCPDPGSMRGCAIPGAEVRCSTSTNPKRKLAHTLEMIRVGRGWVGVHTARANDLAALALEANLIPELSGFAQHDREVSVPGGSRLDFRLSGGRRRKPALLEVKSVTLAEGPTARFPDSVTARGRRHMEVLRRALGRGHRAALLFVVQRADCVRVEPADDIDPAYGEALRRAVRAGVEVYALRTRVSPRALKLEGMLPVCL